MVFWGCQDSGADDLSTFDSGGQCGVMTLEWKLEIRLLFIDHWRRIEVVDYLPSAISTSFRFRLSPTVVSFRV